MNEHVLWAGTARFKSLEDRLATAAAGEFAELTVFPPDVTEFRAAGGTDAELLALAESYDVSLSVLDPYIQWLPIDDSELADYEGGGWFDVDETQVFDLTRGIEVESISVVERFSTGFDVETAAEAFGRFCDTAAGEGFAVHLEFMPFSKIPDLETAWEIVNRADRDNGGLLLDTWHYCQGNRDDDLLRTIPGEKILQVQVCDGVHADADLRQEALHNRRFPGEGEFDLRGVLGILDDIGGLESVGIEAMTDATADLSPQELGERARRTLDETLAGI